MPGAAAAGSSGGAAGPGRPPVPVVVAAVLVTVVPVTVVTWQATTLLALALPALPAGAVVPVGTAVAGVGAVLGVRRPPSARIGVVAALARRAVRVGALAVIAGAVVAAATDPTTPVVGPLTVVVLILLIVAFGAGHGVGDAYRRQLRVTATAEQRRDADRALPFRVLTATGAALLLGLLSALLEVAPGGPRVARWLPLLVLVAGVAGVAAARHLVLRARADPTVGALAVAWRRGTLRIGLVVVVLVALGGALLAAGGGQWLADAIPDPPGWPDTASPFDRTGTDGEADEQRRVPPSSPATWQVLVVVALVVAALVVTRRPRRRTAPGRPGQGLPLWELIRSVLALLRPAADDHVGEETPVAPPAPRARDDAVLPTSVQHLVARLRPRPREPAAAILHDYRAVQRHLDRGDRRRSAETPLHHADRLAVDDLRELADLVCVLRYTTRQVTGDDADRSRELSRRLRRR